MKETSQQTGANIAMAEIDHTIVDIPESALNETDTPAVSDDAVIEMIESVAEEITAMLENGDVAVEIPEAAATELSTEDISKIAGVTARITGAAGVAALAAMGVALNVLMTGKEAIQGEVALEASAIVKAGVKKVLAAMTAAANDTVTDMVNDITAVVEKATEDRRFLSVGPKVVEATRAASEVEIKKRVEAIASVLKGAETRTASGQAVKTAVESVAEIMPEVGVAEGLPILEIAGGAAIAALGAALVTGVGIIIQRLPSKSGQNLATAPPVLKPVATAVAGAVLGAVASSMAAAFLGPLASAGVATVVKVANNATSRESLTELIGEIATKPVVKGIGAMTAEFKKRVVGIINADLEKMIQVLQDNGVNAGHKYLGVYDVYDTEKLRSLANEVVPDAVKGSMKKMVKAVESAAEKNTKEAIKEAAVAMHTAAKTDIKDAITKVAAKAAPLALAVPVTVITAGLTVALGAVAVTTAAVVAKRRADQKINQAQALVQDSELGRGIETGIRPAQQDMPVATIQMENEVMPTSSRRNSNASQASASSEHAGQPANKNLDLMGQSLVMPIEKTGTGARSDIAVKEPKKEQSQKPAKNKRLS